MLRNFLIIKDALFQFGIQLFVMSEKDITAEQIVFSLDNKKKVEYSLLYSAYKIVCVPKVTVHLLQTMSVYREALAY
jgi:hypothetical protein